MRNISFALTTPQFLDGSKDVTRRLRWLNAKAGDELCAVEKGMGLGLGGKVKRLDHIRLVDVRREPLSRLLEDDGYWIEEVRREGFPHMSGPMFVDFFCQANRGCGPGTIITRIEFIRLRRSTSEMERAGE